MNVIRLGLLGGLIIFFASQALPTTAAANGLTSPVGTWQTIDDASKKPRSVVTIWEDGGKLYGKIDKIFYKPGEKEDPLCDKCEGERHNKPVIGMTFMWDLEKDDDEWNGGKILDPDNGEIYKCYVEVQEGGKRLKVRGYVGFALLGRTQYWQRVN